MKKIFALLMVLMMILAPVCAVAEPTESVVEGDAAAPPVESLSWEYLATVTGAAAIVMVIVQLTKGLLDKVWKIPTTLYAYVLAVATMLVATAFTTGLTVSAGLLTLFNGWIVAATAAKSYDVMAGK